MRRSRLLVSVSAVLLLAACGGDDGGTQEAAAEPLVAEDGVVGITGTDQLRWSSDAITAEPGELTVELTCEGGVNHNFVVDGEMVTQCGPGATETGSITLEAGTYSFVCTVPGHQRTMTGTLTVG